MSPSAMGCWMIMAVVSIVLEAGGVTFSTSTSGHESIEGESQSFVPHPALSAIHTGQKVVHLNRRPTQLYYQQYEPSTVGSAPPLPADAEKQQQGGSNNHSHALSTNEIVCQARVPIEDIYATYDDFNRPYVDVFFLCARRSQWCCGIDCCQMNWTFLFAVGCVCAVVMVAFLQVCFRGLVNRMQMRRALRRLHLVRGKRRVIIRANAQRRKDTRAEKFEGVHKDSVLERRNRRDHSCSRSGDGEGGDKMHSVLGTPPTPRIIITRSSCPIAVD